MQPKLIWHGVAVGLLAATLMAGEARAQAALTGVVSSNEEDAMEGVLVSAKREGSTITTTVVTDAQGRYSFPAARMQPGKYTISIRAVGYKLDSAKTVDVPAGGAAPPISSSARSRPWCRNSPTANGCSAFPAPTSRRRSSRCAWVATRCSGF